MQEPPDCPTTHFSGAHIMNSIMTSVISGQCSGAVISLAAALQPSLFGGTNADHVLHG